MEPCGSKLPNAWGLFDMHGNLAEWCQDWYDDYMESLMRLSPFRRQPSPEASSIHARNSPPAPYQHPPETEDPLGPEQGRHRVIRGSTFDRGAMSVRSGNRDRGPPDIRHHKYGFRVAKTCP
jgi:formylglycine-generating enzyme required for sulfatase activity